MKKLLILFFLLSFLLSLKGFIISFKLLIIVIISSIFLLIYKLIKNRKYNHVFTIASICILGAVSGNIFLFFYTKHNAKVIVESINGYRLKHKKFPQKIENITSNKNAVYHLVNSKNTDYFFLYYYVNNEYRHEYDGKRKLWFYSR